MKKPPRLPRLPNPDLSAYRRRSSLPIHPLAVLTMVVIGFGALLTLGVYLITARTVTLVIEGVRRDVRTHQPTVAGLLSELDVLIEAQDIVTPPGETPLTTGLIITIDKAQPVVLEADEQRWRVLTHLIQPRDILAEAGIEVDEHDRLYVDGVPLRDQPYTMTPANVRVERALKIILDDDGARSTLYTVSRTVGQALHEAGVTLYLADWLNPTADAPLEDGSVITIRRSFPLIIQVDGRRLATRSSGGTVGEALAEAGIALVGLDYTVPGESETLIANMLIQVVRVTEEDAIERREIDYRRVTQPDTSIPPETRRIIQQGVKGLLERRVRVRRENGVEVSRSSPLEVIVRDPRDEIIAVGATPSLATPMAP